MKPFQKPVTLATVKADAKLKTMVLAREPRLSVQPVTDEEWKQICKMGGVGVIRKWEPVFDRSRAKKE